jgi:hypothetical protein
VETQARHRFLYVPTLIGIAVVAWTVFSLLHQVVGHAGVAILLGERVKGVSSTAWNMADSWESIVERVGVWGFRSIVVGGPVVNFITGALALLLLRADWVDRSSMRYFLWFFATVSFLLQAPRGMVVGVFVPGSDFWLFTRGLEPSAPWVTGVVVAGLLLTWVGYYCPLRLWMPSTSGGRQVLGAVTVIPVLVAFVIDLLSVLSSPLLTIPEAEFQPFLDSVLRFAPLFLWLVLVTVVPWPRSSAPLEDLRLRQSRGWLVAGLIASFVSVAVMGPGIGSFEGYSSIVLLGS